jgi:hypothetical protein
MMKQFGRTMLTVMGLAVAAVVFLSISIPAQPAGPSVIANALVPVVTFFDMSNPSDPVFSAVEVIRTANTGYMLFYDIGDFNGTFSYFGSGSIPASSVNVSGGSVNAGKVMVTLNVNTCDVTGFTTSSGPCGTFDVSWAEVPVSVGFPFFATRGDTQFTSAGGGKVVINGESVSFGALATGTTLNYSFDVPTPGNLIQETNVTVTVTGP